MLWFCRLSQGIPLVKDGAGRFTAFPKSDFFSAVPSCRIYSPTPNPARRGGECYIVSFFVGIRPQKTTRIGFPVPEGRGWVFRLTLLRSCVKLYSLTLEKPCRAIAYSGFPAPLGLCPGAGNFLRAVFRERSPAKNGPIDFSPFPPGRWVGVYDG